MLPSNFVAERGVSEVLDLFLWKENVTCVMFPFFPVLAQSVSHLFPVPLEELGELSLFPVLVKVTCAHFPEAPRDQEAADGGKEQDTCLGQQTLRKRLSAEAFSLD